MKESIDIYIYYFLISIIVVVGLKKTTLEAANGCDMVFMANIACHTVMPKATVSF